MSRLAAIGMRGAVAVAGGAAMVSGLVLAFQGESTRPPDRARVAFVAAPSTLPATVEPQAPTSTAAPEPRSTLAESPEATAPPDAAAPVAPRPATQTVAPAPTSPAPTSSAPITDIPKYTDVAVLALAADVRLPSGRTFRECVELPPSHEKWPTPVHLYYEGKGKWLVETHVSEVQVVFDEATGTFSGRNFAPTSPECARPR